MTRTVWRPELLQSLPPFSSLTTSEFATLLPSLREQSFRARACIVPAGEALNGLYVVISGRVRLRHEDQQGRALIADTFGPNEFFGEIGLLDGAPWSASIEAAEASDVVYIPRKPLLDCLNQNPAAAMHMLQICLMRLSRAHNQMANLALTDVYGRVAQVLVEHGEGVNGEWHVTVGAEQIAAMVGASREMVSRVVRCMIQKRLLRRVKRKLVVLDRDALSAPTAGRNGEE